MGWEGVGGFILASRAFFASSTLLDIAPPVAIRPHLYVLNSFEYVFFFRAVVIEAAVDARGLLTPAQSFQMVQR